MNKTISLYFDFGSMGKFRHHCEYRGAVELKTDFYLPTGH